MLKPEIKKKWVEALRSGDYKQGHESMRRNNKYCCLGVLTDLFCIATDDVFRDQFNPDLPGSSYSTHLLPVSVRRWSGLESPVIMDELASRNDGVGEFDTGPQTFDQIATIIELREDI